MVGYLFLLLSLLSPTIASALDVEALEKVNRAVLPPGTDCEDCLQKELKAGLHCDLFGVEHGCLYVPHKVSNKNRLVLYFRGHYNGKDHVPPAERLNSINNLLANFNMKMMSDRLG